MGGCEQGKSEVVGIELNRPSDDLDFAMDAISGSS